ncbi:hypothetical protein [Planktothricoides raciborskii]|uniref:Transposase n=1 Tax=Planktothricoides raciborskii GIHE-MW2 TaxID=2792601 RepID=A0AAU8JGR0_9CYAN
MGNSELNSDLQTETRFLCWLPRIWQRMGQRSTAIADIPPIAWDDFSGATGLSKKAPARELKPHRAKTFNKILTFDARIL